ncbi:aminotransferase class I/II-fold pyridoxal phosphate-dependent enzyme [Desulfovermiculus halophilus]|jgi:8-amino-7-oxononanoate synthase|uniref:aminotransferase class I/II-fold pyridoxal phosphate-dependent enzyme n=1 Tax=Desulfovermiculus halophilus TaxID=339722 RepID=UPI0004848A6F|nr:pyridoxal phosphate-dependent aminotransferase family protein [Desulfovermiculus halophilus]
MFAHKFERRLLSQRKAGLFRDPPLLDGRNGKHVYVDGAKVLNLSSNDYLGLGSSQKVNEIVAQNFLKFGSSASSSRLVSANHKVIHQAESAFAEYFGYDECVFFPSGYQANLAVVSTFFDQEDRVFFDKHIHASSVTGLKAGQCQFSGFKHNNLAHLEKRLEKSGRDTTAVLTESLFSMDGDILDVAEFKRLKARHGFLSVIDEAHAFGALGPGGQGIGKDAADIAPGTLGKAMGLFGAFVLMPKGLKSYLFNFASPLIYSTSLPAAHAASALEILKIVEESEDRRERLQKNSRYLRDRLAEAGFQVAGDAHILAVEIGEETKTYRISRRLLERGMFVFSARYPTVPQGRAILRLSMTAMHDEKDIRFFVEQLKEICEHEFLQ